MEVGGEGECYMYPAVICTVLLYVLPDGQSLLLYVLKQAMTVTLTEPRTI